MRKLITLCFALCILFCNASFALSEEGQCEFNGIPYKEAVTFSADLKQAIAKDDKNKIADLITYPLRVNRTPSSHLIIPNKKSFLAHYATLFNAKAKKAIQDDKGIFCNYQGAMLGSGVIWFDVENKSLKIFAINQEK